ncbi:hypothetical protein GCM10027036_02950 [Flavihumibacter cheonanensis]
MDIHEFSQQTKLIGYSVIVEHGAKVRKQGDKGGMEEGGKEDGGKEKGTKGAKETEEWKKEEILTFHV